MRHRKAGRKFNRNSSHRKAMFRNMAKSLIVHGRIRTTEKRAKELRGVVERLVRFALKNDVAARREVYKVLGSHALVKQLFDEIGPRFVGVPGGFTRVLKLGTPRAGDAAPMAIIEFSRTGEEAPVEEKPKKAAPKKAAAPKKEAPKAEEKPVEEAPAEEAAAEEAPAEEAAAEETEKKAE